MAKNKNNQILDGSKKFAIRVINLYKYLSREKKEYLLSKQVLRSGTSIGANVRESVYAQSTPDFVSKLSIALKETNETEYWLELLHETEFITEQQFESIYSDCKVIKAILTSIIISTKDKLK